MGKTLPKSDDDDSYDDGEWKFILFLIFLTFKKTSMKKIKSWKKKSRRNSKKMKMMWGKVIRKNQQAVERLQTCYANSTKQ